MSKNKSPSAQRSASIPHEANKALRGLFFAALSVLSACDYEGAQATDESVRMADEKRQALAGIPCATWVCQKYNDHEPCGPKWGNTTCAPSADYTRNAQ